MIDIYLITNQINGKQYVGKTQCGYIKRFNHHCCAYNYGVRNYISCAIHKYGRENFTVNLIKQVADDTWEYWENYYIKYYHTHISEGGYNLTWGGDSNPTDIPGLREKQKASCNTKEAKERYSKQAKLASQSDKWKEAMREVRSKPGYLEKSTRHWKAYNESRKQRIGMLENDMVIKEFDSCSDACRYLGKPTKEAGNILKRADKFNKWGKRVKIFGYSWTKL